MSLVRLAHRAVDAWSSSAARRRSPPRSAGAGDAGAFGVTLVGDVHAVGVRERAFSLLVESPARLAAPWRGWSTRAPYVPIGALDRPSGESTDRFAADVAGCAAREQADGRGERALPLYRSADEVEVAAFNASRSPHHCFEERPWVTAARPEAASRLEGRDWV